MSRRELDGEPREIRMEVGPTYRVCHYCGRREPDHSRRCCPACGAPWSIYAIPAWLEQQQGARRSRTFTYSDRALLVLAVVVSAFVAGYLYAHLLGWLAGLLDAALG